MRIALVSTLRTAVPPKGSGSVELLVAMLAEELLREGHTVTVFATGDSETSAKLVATLPRGYHHDDTVWDWQLAEFMQLGEVYSRAHDFDIINSHVYCYALPFSRQCKTPTVHTFHICPTPDFQRYCSMFPNQYYVFLSHYQSHVMREIPAARIISNGIDTNAFSWSPVPGTYLAFLGELREDKGPLRAIECGARLGLPVRLAGRPTEFFRERIEPLVDGCQVEYVGELQHEAKNVFLREALALLFPVQSFEACPLVVLEAMACGTPVVAYKTGPLPELVASRVSGLLIDSDRPFVPQVRDISSLSREQIRAIAVRDFDKRAMAAKYLELFREIVTGG